MTTINDTVLVQGGRRRSERAVTNDAAILEAATNEIMRVGVDRLSLREVAVQAGLTHGATYARYEDVNELLVDLWHSQLCANAIDMFEQCVRAVEAPSERTVGALLDVVRTPQAHDVAMVEMLLASRRMPILHEDMEPFFKKYLQPERELTARTSALFTRVLSLFALTMVNLFWVRQFGGDSDYANVLQRVLVTALQTDPSEVVPGEQFEVENLRANTAADNLRAQLCYSTYVVVGTSGYQGATISRIARRAACSPGSVYKLYKSKEDLVLDTFRVTVGSRGMKDSDFAHVLNGEAIAKLLSREASSRSTLRRHFTLETVMAAAHNQLLQKTVGGHLADPGGVVARLVVDDDVKRDFVRHMVHCVSSVVSGVSSLAMMSAATDVLDFRQFAEPLRRGLVDEWRRVGLSQAR